MSTARNDRKPIRVDQLMGRRLGRLLDTLHQQQRLLTQVTGLLPAPLHEHCVGAQASGGVLLLHADSPLWASRLRFQAPALLKMLRQQGANFNSCQVRIQPPLRRTDTRKGAQLSTTAAQQLDQLADGIGDSALSQALHKLAQCSKHEG